MHRPPAKVFQHFSSFFHFFLFQLGKKAKKKREKNEVSVQKKKTDLIEYDWRKEKILTGHWSLFFNIIFVFGKVFSVSNFGNTVGNRKVFIKLVYPILPLVIRLECIIRNNQGNYFIFVNFVVIEFHILSYLSSKSFDSSYFFTFKPSTFLLADLRTLLFAIARSFAATTTRFPTSKCLWNGYSVVVLPRRRCFGRINEL